MTDTGLNHRLRQRSRRAGIMIGISMALTIAVCVAGFSVIYNALDAFTGDFVSRDAPTSEPIAAPTTAAPQQTTNDQPAAPTAVTAADAPTSTVAPSPSPSAFTPDYQVSSSGSVNLRSGPGVSFEPPVTAVPSQAPLQFLNEREATTDSTQDNFAGEWMKFRTEDGQEGWIREIDVETYQP